MRPPLPVDGVRLSLWRVAAIFRGVSLAVCLYLIVRWHPLYARPVVAVLTGAAMIVVTAVIAGLALSGRAHRPVLVLSDVVVTAGLTLATLAAQTPSQQHGRMATLTTIWAAGPAVEAGIVFGAWGGFAAGAVQFGVSLVVRDGYDLRTLNSGVLLVVLGATVGLLATYTARAEDELRVAAAARASVAERERLARSVHDGVLQLLALVHRTGRGAEAPWAELAVEAAAQEASLRALIASRPDGTTLPGRSDLADDLRSLRSTTVTVSTPAERVEVAGRTADLVGGAVRAALDNVERHAGEGARAWVLLEVLDREVLVTVRDDGVGMADGRLDEAERGGRLGVARSVRGRIADLGGQCTVHSRPGEGTEIEMRVPLP